MQNETDAGAFLARLLSDAKLRSEFLDDRESVLRALRLPEEQRTALRALDAADLQRQARTLINKRFHAAAELLPETLASLDEETARRLFDEYASREWPEGHRRHLLDAVGFAEELIRQNVGAVCRWEYNRLRFATVGKRWAVHWVPDSPDGSRRRRAVQVLYRRKGAPRQIAIRFGASQQRQKTPVSVSPVHQQGDFLVTIAHHRSWIRRTIRVD